MLPNLKYLFMLFMIVIQTLGYVDGHAQNSSRYIAKNNEKIEVREAKNLDLTVKEADARYSVVLDTKENLIIVSSKNPNLGKWSVVIKDIDGKSIAKSELSKERCDVYFDTRILTGKIYIIETTDKYHTQSNVIYLN